MSYRKVLIFCGRSPWIAISLVIGMSGAVARADDLQDATVLEAVRLSTDEFVLNGTSHPEAFRADRLHCLKSSCSELAREIAELRLSIEELRTSQDSAARESRISLTDNATAAVPFVCQQLLMNAAAQIADGDESLERTLNDSVSVVHSIEELRQEVVQNWQTQALTTFARFSAEDDLRQTLISAMKCKELPGNKSPDFPTNWIADAKRGMMQLRITNCTGKALKNALVVVDVDVRQGLVNSAEAGAMIVAGELSQLIGIDPTEDQSLILIEKKSDTVNRGGSALIAEWPTGQSVVLSVCEPTVFLMRAQAATISVATSDFTFIDRPVSMQTAQELVERRLAEFQKTLSEKAERDARKSQRAHSRQQRLSNH